MDPNIDDPYKILGVKETASEQEIRSAYRKAALKHHPDRVASENKQEANEMFAKISHAYEVLTDQEQRNAHHAKKNNRYDHDNFFHSSGFHFHDPFDVFDSVFREEFGNPRPNNNRGWNNHRSSRSNRDPFFDHDPFGDDFFAGFGRPFGGRSIFDSFFGTEPEDNRNTARRSSNRHDNDDHHEVERRRSRDVFGGHDPFHNDIFSSMREMQRQMERNFQDMQSSNHQQQNPSSSNSFTSYSSSSTSSYRNKNGEMVTTTETKRMVNGKEVNIKETITQKADGTVLDRKVEKSGDESLLQNNFSTIEDNNNNNRRQRHHHNNLLPWRRRSRKSSRRHLEEEKKGSDE